MNKKKTTPTIHLNKLEKNSENFLNFSLFEKHEIIEKQKEKTKREISTVEKSFKIALEKIKTAGW